VRRRLTAALALAATLGASPAAAIGPEAYLGQVALVATAYCPSTTLPADGRLLQIRDNQALYALLANTYGGDPGALEDGTFALPDLSGKAPPGMLYCIVVSGVWPNEKN
jgi:hypothetical protein